MKEFPNGKYAGSARVKLGRIEDESKGPPPSTTGSNPSSPSPGTRIDAAAGIKLVYIPAGEFQMGSSDRDIQEAYVNLKSYFSSAQPAWFSNEQPKHRVLMTEPFWMGTFEVTQAQWEAVMGSNPSQFRNCPTCPVENVSWDDCQAFIRKLNEMGDGNTYSLPTEAEWEYACRAGTTTPFSFGATTSTGQMNYDGNYPYINAAKGITREKPIQVGSLNQPNPWGLYDMHGNVWEWCADWYGATYYASGPLNDPKGPLSGDSRVLRGGSYGNAANACRSAGRAWTAPGGRFPFNGFRVVMRSAKK